MSTQNDAQPFRLESERVGLPVFGNVMLFNQNNPQLNEVYIATKIVHFKTFENERDYVNPLSVTLHPIDKEYWQHMMSYKCQLEDNIESLENILQHRKAELSEITSIDPLWSMIEDSIKQLELRILDKTRRLHLASENLENFHLTHEREERFSCSIRRGLEGDFRRFRGLDTNLH
jgi:hypothetical protein